jgi:hypothetical protein
LRFVAIGRTIRFPALRAAQAPEAAHPHLTPVLFATSGRSTTNTSRRIGTLLDNPKIE